MKVFTCNEIIMYYFNRLFVIYVTCVYMYSTGNV